MLQAASKLINVAARHKWGLTCKNVALLSNILWLPQLKSGH